MNQEFATAYMNIKNLAFQVGEELGTKIAFIIKALQELENTVFIISPSWQLLPLPESERS